MADFASRMSDLIDQKISNAGQISSKDQQYLSTFAPNIIEWVTKPEYWNVPTTYGYYRQYQILRDLFNLRCKLCNSQDPEDIDCWNKPRSYLESEVLLVWSNANQDFTCPKCGNTFKQFVEDGIINKHNELVCIAGMRSGKSYLGGHIGGYVEHIIRVLGVKGRGYLQRYFPAMEKSEWFEVTFAASTSTQAKETIYAKYREMRNNSPWISKYVSWIDEMQAKQTGVHDRWTYKALDDTIEDGYLKVRFNRVSSDSSGIAGKTRLFAAMDELARLAVTDSKRSAQELYRVLDQSLMTVRGAVENNQELIPHLGMMISVTSPMSIDDYAMQLYYKSIAGENRKIFTWKGATWEFNPNLVYDNFKDKFEKDPVGAMRDFGADPPAAETPLFEDPLRFWKCVDYERSPICSFENSYITDKTGKQYIGATIQELRYNFVDQHYIFCDAAETFDSFAVVCGHPYLVDDSSYKKDRDYDSNYVNSAPEGMMHITQMPVHPDSPLALGLTNRNRLVDSTQLGRLVTVIDFCMRIVPSRERDIYYNSIIDIIQELRKKIKIASVCFDSWQSMSAIQSIREMGIQSNKVKLKSENFLEFRAQLYNDQVSLLPPAVQDHVSLSPTGVLQMATPEEFMQGESVGLVELLKLERSPDLKKIVAPKKGNVRGRGSDDIARCIVGVNFLIKDSVVNNAGSRKAQEARKRTNSILSTQAPIIFKSGR